MGNTCCKHPQHSVEITVNDIERVNHIENIFDTDPNTVISPAEIPLKFSLDGIKMQCKVIDVYDGDTCTITVKLKENPTVLTESSYTTFTVRMYGYDSPEMKQPKALNERTRIKNKTAAHAARDRLISLVLDKQCTILCGKFDKYGRLLGTLFVKEPIVPRGAEILVNVNEIMLNEGFGVPYFGGTKK